MGRSFVGSGRLATKKPYLKKERLVPYGEGPKKSNLLITSGAKKLPIIIIAK